MRLPRRATLRALAGMATLTLLVACAAKAPPVVVPQAAAHPRSIAIIPVLRSSDLTLSRRSPIAFLGLVPLAIERADRYGKQKDFEKRFEPDRTAIAHVLTASLLAAAQKRGYDAIVLDEIARKPEDPEDFDYRAIVTTADVVLHVRVSDIGLLNPMTSYDYEPYVDAEVEVVARESGYTVIEETFRYGVNGSPKDPYSVSADPGDRWPDFETVMAKSDAVGGSWIKGAEALGAHIVSKLPAPPR